ncbi:uncharacterized protein LOC133203959 [Saccostrea echinata]|uniref:uncharacterized protein LOC133203959 n=1 Tax=Saccostrea echinata TaxID=191078 RepID=UPI002A803227|nr:uncharacterized protein LOC133203959 [Saccostrea echinata]
MEEMCQRVIFKITYDVTSIGILKKNHFGRNAAVLSTTTHHPHHTKPHAHHIVNEGLAFHYDHTTHIVALKINGRHHCYLYVLSAIEQQSVHTSTGLHAIEKNMIDLVDSHTSTATFTAQDLNQLSHNLHQFCGQGSALKLN